MARSREIAAQAWQPKFRFPESTERTDLVADISQKRRTPLPGGGR